MLFLVPVSEACVLTGRSATALGFAERGPAPSREGGERNGEASALRLLGESTGLQGATKIAGSYYRSALALAAQVGMRPPIARCHRDLSKLYGRIGKWDSTRDQLIAAITM